MNFLLLNKLKVDILIRKQILNVLLSFMNPTNNLMVALSQNLDKYIVLYQKKLLSIYTKADNSNNFNNIAA